MPYIPQVDRDRYDPLIKPLRAELDKAGFKVGHLNYVLSMLLGPVESYLDARNQVGEVVCCLLEYYRRQAAPYEDEKIEINGDLF